MGTVYMGERLKLGRAVAIKVLHERLPSEMAGRQRFEVEAKAMAQLEHPHCVPVIDVGVHDNKPYIVMELVRGKNLKDLIAEGTFEHGRAAAIVKQILSGLGHAHELGIIHRDIKPPNIVVSNKSGIGEHVRILDFGLAYSDTHSTGHLTDGFAVGTPAYMAPEQCSGQPISARTDVYAVGVVLFELLVGRRPFEHDDPLEIVRMHVHEPPPRLDAIRSEDFGVLETIVARALAKDPADRYADTAAMALALEAVPRPAQLAVDQSIPLDVADIVESEPLFVSSSAGPSPTGAIEAPMMVELGQLAAEADEPQFLATPPAIAPPELPPNERSNVVEDASMVIPASSSGNRIFAVFVLLGLAAAGIGVAFAMGWLSSSETLVAQPDPGIAIAEEAAGLAAKGRVDLALEQVSAGRLAHPTSASLAYRAGRLHAQRNSWRDALTAFRDAIRIDARYRDDSDLIRDVLRGFIVAAEHEPQANFLHDEIGSAAMPFLDETSRTHPVPRIRARAAAELQRY